MSSRKCKSCGEFFSIKLPACPSCGAEYQHGAQSIAHQKVTPEERAKWPNPATRPMPGPCMNQHCEDIRRAYARSEHGAQSTHPLIVKHQKKEPA